MSREITLQANTSGAWKTVCTFDKARAIEVRQAVADLARIIGAGTKWCFVHPDGHREWLHNTLAESFAKETSR